MQIIHSLITIDSSALPVYVSTYPLGFIGLHKAVQEAQ